jgi:hypothetical protein
LGGPSISVGKWFGFKTVKYVKGNCVVCQFFYDMTSTGKNWTAGPSYTDCGGTAFDDCRGGNSCGHDCGPGKPSAHSILPLSQTPSSTSLKASRLPFRYDFRANQRMSRRMHMYWM